MELRGNIVKFRYRSDTNAFKIAELRPDLQAENGSLVIVKGFIDQSNLDMSVTLNGEWVDDPKYGRQFNAKECMRNVPTDSNATAKWLEKQKGIGPKLAESMRDMFGADLSNIIDKDWSKLTKVKRVSQTMADNIHIVWAGDVLLRKVQMILIQGDVASSEAVAKKIIRRFGENSLSTLVDNPYRLTEVSGFGFKTADAMARARGWSTDRPERVESAVAFLLKEAATEGHSYLHRKDLVGKIQELCAVEVNGKSVLLPETNALEGIERAAKRGDVKDERVTINGIESYMCYLPDYYELEVTAAKRIAELLSQPQIPPNNIDAILKKVEKKLTLELSAEQREAVLQAITNNCSVITGLPGTGKSSACKALIQTVKALGMRVMLTAPTGRAAKRLAELTGIEAKTIHRMLQYNPQIDGFIINAGNQLPCDMLIVDEASMLDLRLMVAILEAIPNSCSVVWIGDINQLPSIGAGMVLRDLIGSKKVYTTTLDKIFRQAEGSLIIQNAHRIFKGQSPQFPPKGSEADSYLIPVPKGISTSSGKEVDSIEFVRTMLPKIYTQLQKRYKIDPIRDVQILTPMKVGMAGALAFNELVQGIVNPNGERFEVGGQVLRVGDRVMQTVNDYEIDVFNGDVGFIRGYKPEDKAIDIEFFDQDIMYPVESVSNLTLSYASSVHKSQGSEFPATILILLSHHYVMLDRNIIYTANTRGRKVVVYLSSVDAIDIAVKTQKVSKRNSFLAQRIRAAMKGNK